MGIREQLPPLVVERAAGLGAVGAAWLDRLDDTIAELARRWRFEVGRVLTGGSAGCVIEGIAELGASVTGAILKVQMPDQPFARELAILRAARGHGYAALYEHDDARSAMLLERLGAPLVDAKLAIDAQLAIAIDALQRAWQLDPARVGVALPSGADKAAELRSLIATWWREADRSRAEYAACSDELVARVSALLDERAAAFDPAHGVVAHGDGHPHNLLAARDGTYRFVDPEGLYIERAYDLAILMREWDDDLVHIEADPDRAADLVVEAEPDRAADAEIARRGRARCHMLATQTGVDPTAIWQWAIAERLSSGLLLARLGMHADARRFLRIARAWAAT